MKPIFTRDMVWQAAETPSGYDVAISYNPQLTDPSWVCNTCRNSAPAMTRGDNVAHKDYCHWAGKSSDKLKHLTYVTADGDDGHVAPYSADDFSKIQAAAMERLNTFLAFTDPHDLIDHCVLDEEQKIPYPVSYDPLVKDPYWLCRFCHFTTDPKPCFDMHNSVCLDRVHPPSETVYDRMIFIVGARKPMWPKMIHLSFVMEPKRRDEVKASRAEFDRIYNFAKRNFQEKGRDADRRGARGASLFDRADIDEVLGRASPTARPVPGRRRSDGRVDARRRGSSLARRPSAAPTPLELRPVAVPIALPASRRSSAARTSARRPSSETTHRMLARRTSGATQRRVPVSASSMGLRLAPEPPKPKPKPVEVPPPRRVARTPSLAQRVKMFAASGFGPSPKVTSNPVARGGAGRELDPDQPARRERATSVSERVFRMLSRSTSVDTPAAADSRRKRITRMHDSSLEETKGSEG